VIELKPALSYLR